MTRMRIATATDRERAVATAVLGRATVIPLRTLEQGEQVAVPPARILQRSPPVEAAPIATRMKHGVDRARAPVDPTSRRRHATLREPCLGLGRVVPVGTGSP